MAGRPNRRGGPAIWLAALAGGLIATGCAPAAPAAGVAPDAPLAPPAPVAPVAPDAATVAAGRQLFIRCLACHSRSAAARPGAGPHLEGIVGRPVASLPDFRYSAALRDQAFVWSRQRLDQWLRQPQDQVAGMCLPFTGFPRAADRRALIAFLDSPAP